MTITRIKAATLALAASGFAAIATPAAAFDFDDTAKLRGTRSAPSVAVHHGATTAPAADSWEHSRKRDYRGRDSRYGNDRYYRSSYDDRVHRDTRVWRGRDGRYYCRKDNGTTGLLIGAAVGGLIGNEVAGRGDRTLGTLLGAVGGGLLGREIDRGDARCR